MGTKLLLSKLRGEAVKWDDVEESIMPRKTCGRCMEEKYKDDFASPYEFSKEQQPGFCKPCRDHMKTAGERWCTTCKTWGQDPKTKGSWADGKAWLRTKYCAACPTDKSASKVRKMADSPARQKHNAAQKRSAAEMAATEERMRCRTCEKLLPRDKFSSSQLHDSVALVRRCRRCAEKYDAKTRRSNNQEMAMQCAKCDKSVQAHAEHITNNQKRNASTRTEQSGCATRRDASRNGTICRKNYVMREKGGREMLCEKTVRRFCIKGRRCRMH